jgi:L-fuculose-phosphate aldolase
MNVNEARKNLVDACRRVYAMGFVAGYEGNLSARISVEKILVTPSNMCKGDVTAGDLIIVDRQRPQTRGERRSTAKSHEKGALGRPTAELGMHLMVYDERPDVHAVVHAHPPVATGFAVAGVPIPERALPEVIVALGAIPLVPYALPGTAELADAIRKHIKNADAFLLANHGVLAVGRTIEEAYYRMEMVEQVAKSVLAAKVLGGPVELSKAQIRALDKLAGR